MKLDQAIFVAIAVVLTVVLWVTASWWQAIGFALVNVVFHIWVYRARRKREQQP